MKAGHRHELKTNELAEWLAHFPEWARQNALTIITVLAVVIAAVVFYFWRGYNRNVDAQRQLQLTGLVTRLSQSKMQIIQQQAQGQDASYILLEPAKGLKAFADGEGNGTMAAIALIKRAEAIRAELHYRPGTLSRKAITDGLNDAKAAYNQAIEKAGQNLSLTAMARFGIGLCEEELGAFDEAEKIYREILDNAEFEPTVAFAQARRRIKTMGEYRQAIAFKPAPRPEPIKIPSSPTTIGPIDVNKPAEPTTIGPIDVNQPADANIAEAPKAPQDANSARANVPEDANSAQVVKAPQDANLPAEPNAVSRVREVNLPAEPNSLSKVNDVNVSG